MTTQQKPRIVIDTNLFINATFAPSGASARIIRAVDAGKLEVLVSTAILQEYQQQLTPRYIQQRWREHPDIAATVRSAQSQAVHVRPNVRITASSDPADNKFLECAVSGEADCVISSDDDLASLATVQAVPIYRPGRFVQLYKSYV